MDEIRIIDVKQSIFADNDADAERLRSQLKAEKTFLLNIMASPGAGKTSLLRRITADLKDKCSFGVMEADIDSVYDILIDGIARARETTNATLARVEKAMRIDYFDDEALVEEQQKKFNAK